MHLAAEEEGKANSESYECTTLLGLENYLITHFPNNIKIMIAF